MSHILISAAHKSSGKTVISAGLCAALTARGLRVQPFKKGPDYIDPAWLALASGRPCFNLDFNVQTEQELRETCGHRSAGADISVIEANKGLYDGLDPDGHDSNAALAKLLQCPVILVLDCAGMTRGVAPLLQGYEQFDRDLSIAGVILNRIAGPRHRGKLVAAVEKYTDVPVLGAVSKDARLAMPERHLGLIPANEAGDATAMAEAMREAVAEQVDMDAILAIAAKGKPLSDLPPAATTSKASNLRCGIFRDSAFSFYYPDDLERFEQCGVELAPIDSLRDKALPPLDALFIGGGFPETQAAGLARNADMRNAVRSAIENGMPTYAECGGLMYLARNIIRHGERYPMCGVLEADALTRDTPCGRGYVEFAETDAMPWPDVSASRRYRAHEFHYSRLVNAKNLAATAMTLSRGDGIGDGRDGIVYKNLLATYLHRRNCKADQWVRRFVRFAKQRA